MYSGEFGRAQDLQQRRLQELKELIRCNPVAFQEDLASQADERYMCGALGIVVTACGPPRHSLLPFIHMI